MAGFFILVAAVILGSAFFSGLEAAIFSVTLAQAKITEEQGKRSAKYLVAIKENISRTITVIVVGNNLVNIIGSIYIGVIGAEVFGSGWLGLISAVMTFLIIIFGEIIPKTIGENYALAIASAAARPLLFTTRILRPLVWLLEKSTSRFVTAKKIVSEEELTILSHLGSMEGSIEEDEREMIHKVFTLNDLTARDIMTPRTIITTFGKDQVLGEIANEIYTLPHSRIPVIDGDLDTVVGVCHRWDLLRALAKDMQHKTINDLTGDIITVHEDTKADELLPMFQKSQHHLALVQDAFGGTSGVVTLEDVLEQLVGEIVDETDLFTDSRVEAMRQNGATNQ